MIFFFFFSYSPLLSSHSTTLLTLPQDLAWTGWKNSGKGQTLSKFGFEQFVKLKSYHLKNYPK